MTANIEVLVEKKKKQIIQTYRPIFFPDMLQ